MCKGPGVGKSLVCLTDESRAEHSEQGGSGKGMDEDREVGDSFARPPGM